MDLGSELSKRIDQKLVNGLVRYCGIMKLAYLRGDWEKANLNAGKVTETTTRILQHLTSNDGSFESGAIHVDSALRRIMGLPRGSCDDSLRLRIPRVALTVYDVRSNRSVAHSSTEIDPTQMDSFFVTSACDWILAELVRLLITEDTAMASEMIQGIIERSVPIVQEIDGDVVILDPDLAYKDQLLIVLYTKHAQRVSNEDLYIWTKPRQRSYVTTYLAKLEKNRLVHRNDKGTVLTIKGLRYVEQNVLPNADSEKQPTA